jgi:hypothetical protein
MNTGAIDSGRVMRVSLALIAVVALLIVGLSGPSASASGGNTASAAKKKCKKKKASSSKKKKKCKKKKAAAPKPAPLVRATLNWANTDGFPGSADLDLWVFDSSGNKGRAAANGIPSGSFSPNVASSPGTETFTDLSFLKPGRALSFGVCYKSGGSQHVAFTLDYVTADGVHHTGASIPDVEFQSDGAHAEFDGGAPIPAQFTSNCKSL